MHNIYLMIAIASEVVGTTALKSAEGFTRLGPSVIVVAGYSSAFYFLSLCLERLSVGVAYAIWSGVGIVLIALLGFIVHGQKLESPCTRRPRTDHLRRRRHQPLVEYAVALSRPREPGGCVRTRRRLRRGCPGPPT